MFPTLKKRLYEILEVASPDDLSSRVVDILLMSLIVLNVIAVIVETVHSVQLDWGPSLHAFDVFSVGVFTLEYLLRVWTSNCRKRFSRPILGRVRYALTPMAMIDLLAVLPFYLPVFFYADLRVLRALRLFRLFRLFKLTRYSSSLQTFAFVLREKKEEFLIAGFAMLMMIIFASSLLYFVEHEFQPEAFSSIPASMWWGVSTLTTVGYGDIYPITPLGKLCAGLIAVCGIIMFAMPAGILASGFAEEIERRRGRTVLCRRCQAELTPTEKFETPLAEDEGRAEIEVEERVG